MADRYQLQVGERQTPAAFGRSYGGPEAYGANVAAALVPLGGSVMKWAEYLKKRQDEWDAATVANAQNEYMKRMNEWMNDPQTGQKANRPGGAARGMGDDAYQYADALKNQISGQLENDAQRAAFGKIADKAALPFWKDASEFEARQVKQYQDQAYKSAMDQSMDMALQSPTDPYALETAREQRHNAIRAQMYGADPAAIEQAIRESDSELDQKRFEIQAQDDPVGALAGVNGENGLTPEAKADLQKKIGPKAEIYERQAIVDDLVQRFPQGQEQEALKYIRENYSGEQEEKIASAYKQRMRELHVKEIDVEKEQKKSQEKNYEDIYKKWADGERPSQEQLDAWLQDGSISVNRHGQLSRQLQRELNVAQSRREAEKALSKEPGWSDLTPEQQEERVMRRMGVTKEAREGALARAQEGILDGSVSESDVKIFYNNGWITKNERDNIIGMGKKMTRDQRDFLSSQKKSLTADIAKITASGKNMGVLRDVAKAKFTELIMGLDPTSPTYRQDVLAARRAAIVAGVEASGKKRTKSTWLGLGEDENTPFGDRVEGALGDIDSEIDDVQEWQPDFRRDDITLDTREEAQLPPPQAKAEGKPSNGTPSAPGPAPKGRGGEAANNELAPWGYSDFEEAPGQDGELKPWSQSGNWQALPPPRPRNDSVRKAEIRDAMRQNPDMTEDEIVSRFGGNDIDQAIARGFFREIQKEQQAEELGTPPSQRPGPEQGQAGEASEQAPAQGQTPEPEQTPTTAPEQAPAPEQAQTPEPAPDQDEEGMDEEDWDEEEWDEEQPEQGRQQNQDEGWDEEDLDFDEEWSEPDAPQPAPAPQQPAPAQRPQAQQKGVEYVAPAKYEDQWRRQSTSKIGSVRGKVFGYDNLREFLDSDLRSNPFALDPRYEDTFVSRLNPKDREYGREVFQEAKAAWEAAGRPRAKGSGPLQLPQQSAQPAQQSRRPAPVQKPAPAQPAPAQQPQAPAQASAQRPQAPAQRQQTPSGNLGRYGTTGTVNDVVEGGQTSSRFGSRWGGKHGGIDIAATKGTRVMAPNWSFPLKVSRVVNDPSGGGGFGNNVRLEGRLPDGRRIEVIYAHLDNGSIRVKPGQTVSPGEILAGVGNTGRTTDRARGGVTNWYKGKSSGYHLHFEVRVDGNKVDPNTIFRQYAGKLGVRNEELGMREQQQAQQQRQPAAEAKPAPKPQAAAQQPRAQQQAQGFDYDAYTNWERALESGGKANAKNPNSSATGIDQFTGRTWMQYVNKYQYSWAKGKSRAEILNMRRDPAKSAQVKRDMDREHMSALRRAGLPVTYENMYAAHHFGQGKGVAFARAGMNTPMTSILNEDQIGANPYLRRLTKAQAIANWHKRAGKPGK